MCLLLKRGHITSGDRCCKKTSRRHCVTLKCHARTQGRRRLLTLAGTLSLARPSLGTRSPIREQLQEVTGTDGSVAVEIRRSAGVGTPRVEQRHEI